MATALIAARDPEQWDAVVSGARDGSILQSWAWGELKAQYGWQPARYFWTADGYVRGAVSVLRRPLPGGFAMHYAPHGPVLDGELREWPAFWSSLRRELSIRAGTILKVDPQWPAKDAWILEETGARRGRAIQHAATAMVDLRGGEEAFGRMTASARRNMRKAERAGVTVEWTRDSDAVDQLHALLVSTAERQGFIARSRAYYRNVFEAFNSVGRSTARMYLANIHGRTVAAGMMVRYGSRLVYLFSGSAEQGRQLKAPYAIQQHAIRDAQTAGCTTYDLWGIPVDSRPGDAGWGYAHFKAMLGGQPIEFSGAWDQPVHRPLAVAYHLAECVVARPAAVA